MLSDDGRSIPRNFALLNILVDDVINLLYLNSSFSDCPRPSVPNTLFSISILTGDPEVREYNQFLSGTPNGFVKLWMAETTFKTATSFFFYISLV